MHDLDGFLSWILKYAGQQHIIASQSGVHQGDPLGSDLFALAIHPSLVKVADKHQRVRISGYADNLFLFGRAQYVAAALDDLEKHLLEMGLTVNQLTQHVSSQLVPTCLFYFGRLSRSL